MDSYEATRIVFSRIQTFDPENASKIMGLLLIQDHGEKEMIRLAFGPETLVHSVIVKSRKELGLIPYSNSPPSPSTPLYNNTWQNLNSASRLGITIPNPSWSSNSNSLSSDLPCTDDLFSSPPSSNNNNTSSMNSSAAPFYANGNSNSDMIDEFHLQDQLSFLNDNPNLGPKSPELYYSGAEFSSSPTENPMMYWGDSGSHRRSCSVSDAMGGPDDSWFGWRPCLYYARGFCKNGSNCKFVHSGDPHSGGPVAADGGDKAEMMDQCHEMLRSKSANQQRLAAAQLMSSSFPYSPKCMNFLLQQQQNDTQRAAAALMMADDVNKFGRRNGFDMLNPASRQIYLTFPADSTFREEDVSNYFSIYGPVQDVRIPYQQKRMFGFVTFVYPETVKMILAKGNPHFVCDARVLVKPYKEKGKVPDKYRTKPLPMERGEYSPCGTPTGLDSRDPFDLQLGARMFCNTRDMLWRRKMEEQADLQQALELQSRRLMGLQLQLDAKKHHHHRALSTGSPVPSPTHGPSIFGPSLVLPPFHTHEFPQENCSNPVPAIAVTAFEKQNLSNGKESSGSEDNDSGKESLHAEKNDLSESLEHNLPDSPFASSGKGSEEYLSAFSNVTGEANGKNPVNSVVSSSLLQSISPLDVASFKSFNCQMPRFSSGHGASMYAGANGQTYPVGI